MSVLRVDAIRDNGSTFNDVVTFANSGGTENGKLVRTWVNFDGTGVVAIRANFNVNSITDNGTGDYTVNFSNAMSDANYAISATAGDSGNATSIIDSAPGNAAPTTSTFRFQVINSAHSYADRNWISAAIFR